MWGKTAGQRPKQQESGARFLRSHQAGLSEVFRLTVFLAKDAARMFLKLEP